MQKEHIQVRQKLRMLRAQSISYLGQSDCWVDDGLVEDGLVDDGFVVILGSDSRFSHSRAECSAVECP